MELILIRHATTQGNLEKRFIGTTDIPITEGGRALAEKISRNLPPVDIVYTSPLIRCIQTADILWRHARREVVSELGERDFGIFEGRSHVELEEHPVYKKWLLNPDASDYVESTSEVSARMVRAVRQIYLDSVKRRLRRVGIVSHGGALTCLLAAIGRPYREIEEWQIPNCGGYAALMDKESFLLNITGTVGNVRR